MKFCSLILLSLISLNLKSADICTTEKGIKGRDGLRELLLRYLGLEKQVQRDLLDSTSANYSGAFRTVFSPDVVQMRTVFDERYEPDTFNIREASREYYPDHSRSYNPYADYYKSLYSSDVLFLTDLRNLHNIFFDITVRYPIPRRVAERVVELLRSNRVALAPQEAGITGAQDSLNFYRRSLAEFLGDRRTATYHTPEDRIDRDRMTALMGQEYIDYDDRSLRSDDNVNRPVESGEIIHYVESTFHGKNRSGRYSNSWLPRREDTEVIVSRINAGIIIPPDRLHDSTYQTRLDTAVARLKEYYQRNFAPPSEWKQLGQPLEGLHIAIFNSSGNNFRGTIHYIVDASNHMNLIQLAGEKAYKEFRGRDEHPHHDDWMFGAGMGSQNQALVELFTQVLTSDNPGLTRIMRLAILNRIAKIKIIETGVMPRTIDRPRSEEVNRMVAEIRSSYHILP